MPIYSYHDTKENIYVDITMSISDMEVFEKENPHMERQYTSLNMVDPVTAGTAKPPADFSKYVLGRIKEKHPLGSVEKRWNLSKEV